MYDQDHEERTSKIADSRLYRNAAGREAKLAADIEGGTPSHHSGTPAFLKPAKIPRCKPASSGYPRAVVGSLSELDLLLARQTAAEPITWSRA
jgi:hypothetical protein